MTDELNHELPRFDIHRLGPDEVSRLRALNRLFAKAFEDPETYAARPPETTYLSDLLRDESFVALVAMEGDEVVGGLVAYILRKFEQERSELYIYDLGVAEHWRRQGIATSLIKSLKRIAQETGAWVVYVQADKGDDPAISLYEKLGIREDVLHFDMVIR